MRPRFRLWTLAAVVFSVLAGGVPAALRVCGSCGHEADEQATTCGHCHAQLPPPAAVAPVETAPERPPESAAGEDPMTALAPVLANQIRIARALIQKKDGWRALFFARNASALAGLMGPEGATIQREMEQGMAQIRSRLGDAVIPCPACAGTGELKKRVSTMKGETVDQVVSGGHCPLCQGPGVVPGRTSADALQRGESDAQRAYELEQRRLGLTAWQGIYLPAGLATNLSPRSIAALRHGYGVWCPSCNGFRSIPCENCRGAGMLKCVNAGCLQGQETCPTCKGKGRASVSRTVEIGSGSSSLGGSRTVSQRCEDCKGLGIRPCADCEGQGYIICSDCKGRGDTLCRKCKGSGTTTICPKCKGDGVAPCSRCQGKGKNRKGQPCEACGGEGTVLCKSCEGAGRGK